MPTRSVSVCLPVCPTARLTAWLTDSALPACLPCYHSQAWSACLCTAYLLAFATQLDLTVNLVERKTGGLGAGGGLSTQACLGGLISLGMLVCLDLGCRV